jgi:hypothetical protein
MLAAIYRPVNKDRHGDPEDRELIGYAVGVIVDLHSTRADIRGEAADMRGRFGFPTSGTVPRHGDRIVAEESVYEVVGHPLWEDESPFTGTGLGYAWLQVAGRSN